MKKLFLMLFIILMCSVTLNAQEILFKMCTDLPLYTHTNNETPSFIKANKNDVVWVLGKKDEFIYIRYSTVGAVFRVKIEDIKDCELDLDFVEEYNR